MDSRRSAQIKRMKRRWNYIPDELSSEILSRMPVRSVIRFRCVCKLWRSITNDPKFIDAHLDHARKADPPSILFLTRKNWGRYGVAIIHHDWRAPKRILWWPTQDLGHLSGSCNGLLCIYHRLDGGSITVLNPATMESLTLPEHTMTRTDFLQRAFLGFHPETKEYKVVRFFCLSCRPFLTACEVHTLGTSSWRRIGHPHNCFPDDPATVDGVMHWTTLDDKGLIALSFDLKVEKFNSIPFPDSNKYRWTNLVELQGSVCLPIFPKDARSLEMDIWMLIPSTDENDNLKHEWGLKYSGISLGCRLYVHRPLFIHGDKVLTHRSKRVVWDGTMSGFGNDGMDDSGTLIYYPLKSKGEGTIGEVFYRLGELTIPPIFNYLKGQHHLDEDPIAWLSYHLLRCSKPFVHVESLVSLRNR